MKTTNRIVMGSIMAVALASCATTAQEQQATEQPTRTIEPGSHGSRGGGEGDFVLSRFRSSASQMNNDEMPPLHIADDWWRYRSEFLRISPAQARERDAQFSERQPPPIFWDQQTAIEAAAVWGSLCNECHGGRRRVEDAAKMPPPPAGWGRGDGLFFGQRRAYDTLFNVVNGGGPERNGKKSEMPAWRGRLAREQIWAILYFLEYQSGGIEGRFPPSLYPRQSGGNN
jgi:mono/diheme cytochrome c family protein